MSSNVGLSDAGKDRRTRMVTSSFKAPAKKDGAGGSHTWGGAKDVTDYAPIRTSVSKVSVGLAPASAADHQRSAFPSQKLYLKDIRQFPDLGAKPAPIAVKWVPQPPPTSVQVTEEAAYRYARAVRRSLSLAEHALPRVAQQVLSTRCPLIGQLLGLPR